MPQGSVLGPVLFIVYINDISDCVLRGSKMKLYADDANVYTVIDDLNSQAYYRKVLTLSWLGLDTGSLHCLNLNVLYCICLSVLIILACVNILLVTVGSL